MEDFEEICDSLQLTAKTNLAMRFTLPVRAFQDRQTATLSHEKQFLYSARLTAAGWNGVKQDAARGSPLLCWSRHTQAGLRACHPARLGTPNTRTLSWATTWEEESRETFFLPLDKNSSETILLQTGRKGGVKRKGHSIPLHVGIQDKATGPAHWSTIALKGLWWTPDHLQHHF